jgi:hypothetical protein
VTATKAKEVALEHRSNDVEGGGTPSEPESSGDDDVEEDEVE